MKKFSILKQRIREFAENQSIDIKEIYKNTGISDGTLSNNSGFNEQNILKFFSYYTNVNTEWFLLGIKPMLKSEAVNIISDTSLEYNKTPKIIELHPEAKANTLVANVKASAGFGSLLQDSTKLEELPAITLPNAPYGLNIAFQIDGDSMHPSIQHLSHVAGNQLNSLDDFRNGYVYIVIDKYDGAVCKRVYRTSSGFELVSDNPKYPPYDRTYEEVLGLFKAFGRYSTDFRSYYDDLRIDIKKINDRLLKIENRLNA